MIDLIVASFCCMLVIFGGLYMLALNPDLQQPDYAVVEYVRAYFHPIISTLLCGFDCSGIDVDSLWSAFGYDNLYC